MHNIYVFVPESYLNAVKNAMFDAGAGHMGDYDCCSWQTLGQGQFRPLSGSQPFIGQQDKVATIDEYKLEMICDEQYIKAAVKAMKSAHPYETPAYHIVLLCDDF